MSESEELQNERRLATKREGLGFLAITALVMIGVASWFLISKGWNRLGIATTPPTIPALKSGPATWKATLPDGAVVKFHGIGVFPDNATSWWRGDGTPVPGPSLRSEGASLTVNPTQFAREFAIDILGPSDASLSGKILVGVSGVTGPGSTTTPDGKKLITFRPVWAFSKETNRTTIVLNYSSGPWNIVHPTPPAGKSGSSSGAHGSLVWGEGYEKADGSVGISVASSSLASKECRVVAIDTAGEEHLCTNSSLHTAGQMALLTVNFPKLKLSTVKEFQFQSREYNHFEIRNISLQPGMSSDCEFYLNGKKIDH